MILMKEGILILRIDHILDNTNNNKVSFFLDEENTLFTIDKIIKSINSKMTMNFFFKYTIILWEHFCFEYDFVIF